jgi:predicted dienelactone hydrolase
LPLGTGPYAVGRRTLTWVDAARPEVMTAAPADRREVIADIWYPAQAEAGADAAYFPNLEAVAADLVASGEVAALEAAGLRYMRTTAQPGAPVAAGAERYPVLILSPGNATNVEFYAALALTRQPRLQRSASTIPMMWRRWCERWPGGARYEAAWLADPRPARP